MWSYIFSILRFYRLTLSKLLITFKIKRWFINERISSIQETKEDFYNKK